MENHQFIIPIYIHFAIPSSSSIMTDVSGGNGDGGGGVQNDDDDAADDDVGHVNGRSGDGHDEDDW